MFNLTSAPTGTLGAVAFTKVLFSLELVLTLFLTVPVFITRTVKVNWAEPPLAATEPTYQIPVSLFQVPGPAALVTTAILDKCSVTLTPVAVELPLLVTVIT